MKLADYKSNHDFTLLVGRSGSGKSCAGISRPGRRDIWDVDYRIGGIAACPFIEKEGLEFEQFPPTPRGCQKLLDRCAMYNSAYQNQGSAGLPKSLQLDSLTSLTSLLTNTSEEITKGQTIKDPSKGLTTEIRMSGPGDYKFEHSGIQYILDAIRPLPMNFYLTAHIINRYGKPSGKGGEYAENIVIGEQLNARDKIAERVVSVFDNVWRFDKIILNNEVRFMVEFNTDLAKNTYGIPWGTHNVTGIPFYKYLEVLKEFPTEPWQKIRERVK